MSPSHVKSAGNQEEKQRDALVKLLTDDDDKVYRTVRETILAYGPSSSDWLRKHTLSSDPILRRRAGEIIDHFARQDADTDFLAFCLNQGEEPDLERGVFLLCRTQYPRINLAAYSALLDEYAGDLRERLNLHATADQILPVINDYLFLERKFAGDELNLCDPENCYLNRVLDRRVGNHVTLGLLYLLLARRLHLPMVGIGLGLPDQFLCRYQSSLAEIYIDPLHGGRQLLKVECIKMVMQLQHRFDDSFLAPLSARRILLRICASLHRVYIQQRSLPQAERLKRYLVILAK